MDYVEAWNYLSDLRRFDPRPGIESTAELLSHLGDPHEGLACVQVAGSNGKGSTTRMVERALREAGLSVGLYTSPHMHDVRERVRVDGRKIPKRAVTEFVEQAGEYITDRGAEGVSPTYFEVLTAMALWHFDRTDVDVAVLEVGIGGRKDATSVVDPVASAVTTVSLEHTEMLGDTVEEIARDKAQVAPSDRPLVTGATGDALAAIRETVGDVVTAGPPTDDRPDPDVAVSYGGLVNHFEAAVELDGPGWSIEANLPLLGAHQAENAAIAAALARTTAKALDVPLDDDTLARGLRGAYCPGRFEVFRTDPLVVVDGAHNPGACRRIEEVLGEFDYDGLHLAFGAMHDKDHERMVEALPDPDRVVTCSPETERAEAPEVLARIFERNGDAGEVVEGVSVSDAVEDVLGSAGEDDCVLIAGSLSVVAEARSRWVRPHVSQRIDDPDVATAVLSEVGASGGDVRRTRDDAVHRVVETRLLRRQARTVETELLDLGGSCVVSEYGRASEQVPVVLTGTLSQFRSLVDRLDDRGDGLPRVADELREQLGFVDSDSDPMYPWDDGTSVMGILNVTPDSFHDGGEYDRLEDALERAERMAAAGAEIIDVGGESTRPGADPLSAEEEIERVVPVIEAIDGAGVDALISVDTRRAAVAEAALEAGADMLNDVSGLEDPEMRFVAAEHDAPIVVMHSIETPVDPDTTVEYDDVVRDVIEELNELVLLAERAGLDRRQILVDPGLGFGKAAEESFEILDRLDEFRALGCPVLVGHSHKSMFELAGYGHGERLEPTIAGTALAAERGADVIRVHDVPENLAAVRVAEEVGTLGE